MPPGAARGWRREPIIAGEPRALSREGVSKHGHLRARTSMEYSWGMSPSEYQELTAFLAQRFDAIDQRFDAIAQRFEAIDRRFEAIDRRFEAVDRRFEAVDRRFDAVDQRFEALEGQITALREEILGHFDKLYLRIERLEQEYLAIAQALRRIEAGQADVRTRRERLERDLATLRENVAVLRARIDEVERRLPPRPPGE